MPKISPRMTRAVRMPTARMVWSDMLVIEDMLEARVAERVGVQQRRQLRYLHIDQQAIALEAVALHAQDHGGIAHWGLSARRDGERDHDVVVAGDLLDD